MNKFFLNWHKAPYKNIDLIIIGLCDIVDGIVLVMSLGFFSLATHFRYVKWRTLQMIEAKRQIEEHEKVKENPSSRMQM